MLLQAGKMMFDISGILLERIPLAAVLDKRVQKGGLIFVYQLLQDQEHLIRYCRKSGKDGRGPAQISKKLLTELRYLVKGSMQEVEKILNHPGIQRH